MSTPEGSSVTSSVINTVNTIIGSGILVLPYAFRTDAILLGSFIIIFAGIANGFGMILQSASAKFLPPGTATFFTVCRITYPKLSVIFDLAIFLQCFGVNVSYLVLTGDLLPFVFTFDGWDTYSMKVFYIVLSTSMIVPLCMLRKIDSLKYASVVALIAIFYICLLIQGSFLYAFSQGYSNIPTEKLGEISIVEPQGIKPIFKTLGIIVLAYTCPTQFSIVGELSNPTIKRTSKITYISMSIVAIVFLSVALCGYLTFGDKLTGNILLMYDNNIYSQTGRSLLVLMVILSFPLMFHPARVSINNIYHVFSEKVNSTNNESEAELIVNDRSPLLHSRPSHTSLASLEYAEQIVALDEEDVPMSDKRFYILTSILLLSSYSCALLLNSFELILAVVGSTGGVLISFVLPGFYGYKVIASEDDELINRLFKYSPSEANNSIFYSKLIKKLSLFLIFWGVIVMFICLYSIFFE